MSCAKPSGGMHKNQADKEGYEGCGAEALRNYRLQACVGKAGQSTQTGESAFVKVNGEPLEISTSMHFHAEAILGEYFWSLGSLYYLDL